MDWWTNSVLFKLRHKPEKLFIPIPGDSLLMKLAEGVRFISVGELFQLCSRPIDPLWSTAITSSNVSKDSVLYDSNRNVAYVGLWVWEYLHGDSISELGWSVYLANKMGLSRPIISVA